MTHSIEIWRADLTGAEQLPHAPPPAESDLPAPEDGDDAVVELCRKYPGLPRAIAEYLAR
jgi:hypothetical protein